MGAMPQEIKTIKDKISTEESNLARWNEQQYYKNANQNGNKEVDTVIIDPNDINYDKISSSADGVKEGEAVKVSDDAKQWWDEEGTHLEYGDKDYGDGVKLIYKVDDKTGEKTPMGFVNKNDVGNNNTNAHNQQGEENNAVNEGRRALREKDESKEPTTGGSEPSGEPTTGGSEPSGEPSTGGSEPSGEPTTGGSEPSTGGNEPSTGGNGYGSTEYGDLNGPHSSPQNTEAIKKFSNNSEKIGQNIGKFIGGIGDIFNGNNGKKQ